MLGKRAAQTDLFTADTQYLQFVGEDTFYGFLARQGRELFRDEDFAQLYCADNGRTSVPPSRLCLALLLQVHDGVSDEEAKRRADFDLRWKVALGVGIDTRPFAKSTCQVFRAQLVIHDGARAVFQRSLAYAKQLGYLQQRRKLRVALDSSFILGRGAVEDTYNLLAEGIRLLSRALARVEGRGWEVWLSGHGFSRYAAPSIKGAAEVDWEDAASREAFLSGLIADGERVLEITRGVRAGLEAEGEADRKLVAGAELLSQLLWQDVEPTPGGHRIKQGTAKDRVPSVHDPEQRHGRKCDGRTFTGHKVGLAVAVESQLITAVEVVAGNASDGAGAVSLVEASEANTGEEVGQVLGDTAYGGMAVREALGKREVVAPTVKPRLPKEGEVQIGKADFTIDTEAELVRCPQGEETRSWRVVKVGGQETKRFTFPGAVCAVCPRVEECVNATRRGQGLGREVTLHPQEARLQEARAFEQTDYFREQYRQRGVVEHRIARLMGLGLRQARYLGRAKVLFQALLAATVANLTLLMGKQAAGTVPAAC